ncbi:MAG: hypothetical protein WC342_08055 [Methanoregula sp.]|jgi:hypothetical protein
MKRNYLDFTIKNEVWNTYRLKDGITLSLKIVLINVLLEGEDKLGNPQLGFQMNNILGIRVPDDWTQLPKEDDIGFDIIHDDWNEYKTTNGYMLQFKPIISQISRSGQNDPMGNPVYLVQSQPMVKIRKT